MQGAVDGGAQRLADAALADGVDFLAATLERLDDARVPLRAGPLGQDFLDAARRYGLAVGAGRAHGVVAVGHRQDTRQ